MLDDFIRPGKPVENPFIEAFNGRLRDECLNLHQFTSIADAQAKIKSADQKTGGRVMDETVAENVSTLYEKAQERIHEQRIYENRVTGLVWAVFILTIAFANQLQFIKGLIWIITIAGGFVLILFYLWLRQVVIRFDLYKVQRLYWENILIEQFELPVRQHYQEGIREPLAAQDSRLLGKPLNVLLVDIVSWVSDKYSRKLSSLLRRGRRNGWILDWGTQLKIGVALIFWGIAIYAAWEVQQAKQVKQAQQAGDLRATQALLDGVCDHLGIAFGEKGTAVMTCQSNVKH